MEEFQRRIQASFGHLHEQRVENRDSDDVRQRLGVEPSTEAENGGIWMPSLVPVYRNENIEASSDDEVEERRRRMGLSTSVYQDDELEFDASVGIRPSLAFCSQVDKEEESDSVDIASLQFDDKAGNSPCLQRSGSPLPSALKKKGGGQESVGKKRVSFTGLPEPPKPYVPPHKRNCDAAVVVHDNVPDHVKNPGRYTKYEFDEPVCIGGGISE